MKVLLIGSGGREHALGWALSQSPDKPEIYALPGNPGLARLGTNLPGDPGDHGQVLGLVRELGIDLVIIGPEVPLVAGLADDLRDAGVRAFGPSAGAAAIEGSKVFSKELMLRHDIPTAGFQVVTDADTALELLGQIPYPHVLKADGLAAGKGALIVETRAEAEEAVSALMVKKQFGAAGDRVVFEEFLEGEEMSVFAVATGEQYVLLPPSQDYKRAKDGDRGGNTGGMGAYAPVVGWNRDLEERVRREVIEPTLQAMIAEGVPYSGLLYAGLMVKDGRPSVVEFNCRFGDPETQIVLPILNGDLLELLWKASAPSGEERLPEYGHDGRSAVCVVVASDGYPGQARTGYPITGLEEAEAHPDAIVFHAGTALRESELVNKGGRVLNVVGLGDDLPAARDRAYEAAAAIQFDGAFYRRDIAWRGMEALGRPLAQP